MINSLLIVSDMLEERGGLLAHQLRLFLDQSALDQDELWILDADKDGDGDGYGYANGNGYGDGDANGTDEGYGNASDQYNSFVTANGRGDGRGYGHGDGNGYGYELTKRYDK